MHNIPVKLNSRVNMPYLTILINRSLDENVFPVSLKKTTVIPSQKKGSKLDADTTARYHYSLYEAKFSPCMHTRVKL